MGRQVRDRFTGFFAVEDSISERLTRALALRLSEQERKGLTARGTTNLEAHQWYLKGRYYSAQWTVDGFTRALDAFHHAIAIDPTYALAYAGQADAYYRATTIHLTPQEGVPRARAAALAALRLDDNLAEAHAALGIIKFRYDWDFAGAEKEFRRAIALNAEDVEAHQWYSEYLTAFGRVPESVAEAKTAQQIDPLSPEVAWDLGLALLFGNRNREAIEQLKNAVDLDPRFWLTHTFLAWAYAEDGNYDLAYAEYAKAQALDDNADILSQWILVAHEAGRTADAQRMLDDLLQRAKTHYVAPFYIAAAYIAVRDNDRGFEWLQKALAERNELLVFIKVAPSFRSVRGDPRFIDILRRSGCLEIVIVEMSLLLRSMAVEDLFAGLLRNDARERMLARSGFPQKQCRAVGGRMLPSRVGYASDGTIWATKMPPEASRYLGNGVWVIDRKDMWFQALSVGSKANVYGISSGKLYAFITDGVQQLDPARSIVYLSVSAYDGTLWGLDIQKNVYFFQGKNWNDGPPGAPQMRQVSVVEKHNVIGTKEGGAPLQRWDGGSWSQLSLSSPVDGMPCKTYFACGARNASSVNLFSIDEWKDMSGTVHRAIFRRVLDADSWAEQSRTQLAGMMQMMSAAVDSRGNATLWGWNDDPDTYNGVYGYDFGANNWVLLGSGYSFPAAVPGGGFVISGYGSDWRAC